jgi:hypothetical protein
LLWQLTVTKSRHFGYSHGVGIRPSPINWNVVGTQKVINSMFWKVQIRNTLWGKASWIFWQSACISINIVASFYISTFVIILPFFASNSNSRLQTGGWFSPLPKSFPSMGWIQDLLSKHDRYGLATKGFVNYVEIWDFSHKLYYKHFDTSSEFFLSFMKNIGLVC